MFKEYIFIFSWENEQHDVSVNAVDESQAIDIAELLAYKAGETLNTGVEFELQRFVA